MFSARWLIYLPINPDSVSILICFLLKPKRPASPIDMLRTVLSHIGYKVFDGLFLFFLGQLQLCQAYVHRLPDLGLLLLLLVCSDLL